MRHVDQRPLGEPAPETLAGALEREHREIDHGIGSFLAGLAQGQGQIEPLRHAMEALRRHIFLEEEFLFPPLREAGMVAPIFVMLREHGEIWDTLEEIDARLRVGEGDAALVVSCETLLAQLERHNAKEEPIVYAQADAILTAATHAGIREFFAAGRIPGSWVCAGARAPGRSSPD